MRKLLSRGISVWSKSNCRFSTVKQSESSIFSNPLLNSSNVNFLEGQYARWAKDPASVPQSFSVFFDNLHKVPGSRQSSVLGEENSLSRVDEALRMKLLLDAYRLSGHEFADTDPLHVDQKKNGGQSRSVIDYRSFGFTQADLDKKIDVNDIGSGIGVSQKTGWTLRKLVAYLEKVYCGKAGFEYMHLTSRNERMFMREKIENLERFTPSKEQKLQTWKRLHKEESFNQFLVKKFSNNKRFGIEGLNSVIGAVGVLVEEAANNKIEYIALGMAHRGRLNMLHCAFDLPAENIYELFLDKKSYGTDERGDVKYHIGFEHQNQLPSGNKIKLSLLPNPSHLEAVDPLIYGRIRAIQDYKGDKYGDHSLGILIHGDAAVAGQGVVYESLEMQDLNDYSTGGIIHIVMNNQIGFTTEQLQGRSTFYSTEIGKVVNAPVFHINADEPDLLDKCIKIALEYRQTFHKDIFIDVIGYRRYGHNEQDQPLFTQPIMYHKIKNMPSVFAKYNDKLVKEGIVTEEQVEDCKKGYAAINELAFKTASEVGGNKNYETLPEWQIIKTSDMWGSTTGVAKTDLDQLVKKVTTWPQGFNVHATIKRLYDERIKNYNAGQGLDMATMESLAFASLLKQGFDLRLSGQDVERGTFSHRHAVLSDQKIDREKFMFLKSINPKATICNSHLSEFGVMGFEYGYSITNPNALVLWEAQFGDFSNVAQIMIDNFVVSGQGKWKLQSGLVLNLPHGMDGQGPEHSSARLERFLQASNDKSDIDQQKNTMQQRLQSTNIQVVYCSNSANYFHVLRRQMKRDFRKPLILMVSKKLLKLRAASSKVSDITVGTQFLPIIQEAPSVSNNKVTKLVFCSGQFYYDLRNTRDQRNMKNVTIVRVQQLSPFPVQQVKQILAKYPQAEVCWAQEQHQNQGAWGYIRPRLKALTKQQVNYYGRNSLAASACGTLKHHKMQEQLVLKKLLG